MIFSIVVWAAAATDSGDSPARMRAWMSRGRRALSMVISNWPRRACSPRSAARSRASAGRVNSSPAWLTRTSFCLSSVSPTSVRSCSFIGSPAPFRRSWSWARAYFLTCPAPGTPHAGRRPVLRSDAGRAPYPDLVLVVLDLVGIFVFAITGALVAVRKDLDVFAVLVLAGVTGLGGGFIRDLLIGAVPPAALADWRYLLVPVVAGTVTFYFHPTLGRAERVVNVLDAAGLSLFCVTGALKALDYGLGPVPAALLGMVTGIGGGVARDVLAG